MSRKRVGALKPKTVISSMVVCTALCLAGLGYVWAKTQLWGLSAKIKKLEMSRDELRRGNDALQRTYAAMCTHERLAARVKELQLGLSAPSQDQMIRLLEPPSRSQQQPPPRYYAVKGTE